MKILFVTILVTVIAGCASSPASTSNWRQEGYEREMALMEQRIVSKEITVLQAHRQMLAASRTFFPNDTLLVQLWEDLVVMAEQVDKQQLQMEEFIRLSEMRWRIFNDANLQRHKEVRYQEAQQRRSEFMGNFLAGMARSMQRDYPQPITCRSTSMPGVVTTNCQ